MKPKDVVQQLCNGTIESWDDLGTMTFSLNGSFTSPKGMKAKAFFIDFDLGVVAFQNFPKDENGDYDTIQEEKYAIKAELVPITENDEEPVAE